MSGWIAWATRLPRAALIYLHGSDQRQRQIAQALSDLAAAELKRRAKHPKGQAARKAPGT